MSGEINDDAIVHEAEKLKNRIESSITTAKTRSAGFVQLDDGRIAEVQLKVECDEWEWIDHETAAEEYGWEEGDQDGGTTR